LSILPGRFFRRARLSAVALRLSQDSLWIILQFKKEGQKPQSLAFALFD
jgi:hypothetical protein